MIITCTPPNTPIIVPDAKCDIAVPALPVCTTSEFNPNEIETIEAGKKGTLEYKMYFEYDGKRLSPWHDIPLYANKEETVVNFICEIPKGTAAKFEISRTIKGNPIVQDRHKNPQTGEEEPRSYQWPAKEPQMFWNYGALPQTWEDPGHEEKDIAIDGKHPRGDNDPIDAIMIGNHAMTTGEVCAVKILGVIALIDDGETDWKLLVVDANDKSFENINTLGELLEDRKSEVQAISDWIRDYKTISRGRTNHVHWDGQARDEKYAMSKVVQTHGFWVKNTNSGSKNRELAS